jgi:hypothetical protein
MEAAASIAGLIGPSGQALQGCALLSVFFADAQNAPKRIQDIGASVDFAATMHQKLEDSLIQQYEEGAITSSDLIHVESVLRTFSGIVNDFRTVVTEKAAHLLLASDDGTAPAAVTGASACSLTKKIFNFTKSMGKVQHCLEQQSISPG